MSTPPQAIHDPEEFVRVQRSPQFDRLRRNFRSFAFPMTIVFLVWYFAYVLLAIALPQVMAVKVLGNINLGFVLGVLQFVSTFVITGLYVKHANKNLDPIAEQLRAELENGTVPRKDS